MKKQKANITNVTSILLDYMRTYKIITSFFIFFGIFWAFTLPYMSYLFGVIIDRIKTQGLSSVSVYSLVLVPLALYVIIHVLRSFGYYGNFLYSLLSIPAYKAKIVEHLFRHLGQQSIDYFEDQKSGFLSHKIIIAIAHRLSTIRHMDRIVVMEGGVIIEEGSFDQLISNEQGYFKKLWGSQVNGMVV